MEIATAEEAALAVGEPPRVMIGVTLSSETIVYDDERETVESTRITSVVPGGPAAKAGIKPGDIVVGFGEQDGRTSTIREVLADKAPGDVVTATVLREGEEVELEIKLEAYEPEVFTGIIQRSDRSSRAEAEALRGKLAELSAKLEIMGEKLARANRRDAEVIRRQMSEVGAEMANIGAQLARQSAEATLQGLRLRLESDGDAPRAFWRERDDDGVVVITPPNTPAPPSSPFAEIRRRAERERALELERTLRDREQELDRRDRELNERLDRFDRQMERMMDLIERIADRQDRVERDLDRERRDR